MAKVRNAANTIRQGRIGENTWYVRDGVQVVRQRLQNSNYGEGARRSSAQQERRAKWGNLVNFYKVIKSWQPQAYESLKKGVTDYNAFMQLNANSTRVYLTRQLVEAGGAVVAPYIVSKGTIPAITLTYDSTDELMVTNIVISTNPSTSGYRVGQLAADIIANNPQYQEGDNIAFIQFSQVVEAGSSVPRVSSVYKEITLDTASQTPLSDYGNFIMRTGEGNYLMLSAASLPAGSKNYAFIHTRRDQGSLMVSTSSITMAAAVPTTYTDDTAKAAAIASYGVDGDVPLAPGE